jgi:hypothetical protein
VFNHGVRYKEIHSPSPPPPQRRVLHLMTSQLIRKVPSLLKEISEGDILYITFCSVKIQNVSTSCLMILSATFLVGKETRCFRTIFHALVFGTFISRLGRQVGFHALRRSAYKTGWIAFRTPSRWASRLPFMDTTHVHKHFVTFSDRIRCWRIIPEMFSEFSLNTYHRPG